MTALRRDGLLAGLLFLSILCYVTATTARQGAAQGRKLLVCNAAAIRQCPLCCETVPDGQSRELVGTVTSSNSNFGTTKQADVRSSTTVGNTGTRTGSSVPMEAVQSQSQEKPRLMDMSNARGSVTSTASG